MPAIRVLVVDDDPDIIDYFSSFLSDQGYVVEGAKAASSGLAMLETFKPDIVLIDVMMPGKSGLDLLVSIRKHTKWCNIPLVVITGNDRILEDDCQTYLHSHEGVRGPDGVLGKPVDRTALLAVVRALLTTKE